MARTLGIESPFLYITIPGEENNEKLTFLREQLTNPSLPEQEHTRIQAELEHFRMELKRIRQSVARAQVSSGWSYSKEGVFEFNDGVTHIIYKPKIEGITLSVMLLEKNMITTSYYVDSDGRSSIGYI